MDFGVVIWDSWFFVGAPLIMGLGSDKVKVGYGLVTVDTYLTLFLYVN